MIRVEGLTKAFGTRLAISGLSFDASKGEILGFLGPNGAGKTTTLRILTGYLPPTSGKAEIGGYDVVEKSLEVRRLVGYLPETVPLYPEMTVFEYLKFMADLRKMKRPAQRIDEILDLVQLSERAQSHISNLSKGMRQRVGLAQALLHKPDVLILDEPTIGLDPAQIIEVRNIIKAIGKEHTILLSTHILSEAQQVCNRVLIINKGKIVAEDTPERLQARLTGAQRIILRVRGDATELSPVLAAIPGINCISVDDDQLEIDTTSGDELRPIIAKAAIQAGYDLLELRAGGMSLEDIFLQLTRDETPAPEVGFHYHRGSAVQER